MNRDERLPVELWNTVFPVARFYVRYLAPLALLLYFLSICLHWFSNRLIETKLASFVAIGALSWFYYGEYQKLKSMKPASIGSVGIAPNDSIGWAMLVVWLGAAAHLVLTLSAAMWFFATL